MLFRYRLSAWNEINLSLNWNMLKNRYLCGVFQVRFKAIGRGYCLVVIVLVLFLTTFGCGFGGKQSEATNKDAYILSGMNYL
jgi:hypothetical protein